MFCAIEGRSGLDGERYHHQHPDDDAEGLVAALPDVDRGTPPTLWRVAFNTVLQ